jgi:tetratricopeptide (TPR) repeat protein
MALLLALGTLLVFLPAADHGFSIFDDDDYVTANPVVQNGLTWAGVKWAFTTGHASNWHPVTWLSHMTDCELFGLNAGAHHSVSLLLHAASAALLLLLLFRLTGALWPSAFVAALFAWHPLHVESVAWIAERKDVLSTFFALLALLSYAKFAKEDCRRSFWLALLFFALGLMAKPMLVTLPFVMLLLDYWPLQRVPSFGRLVFEKWPFFVLVAVSCVITFLVQRQGGMVASLEEIPLSHRLDNVPLAYTRYLLKLFWPSHLAIFYPLPKIISLPAVVGAAAVLLAVTAAAWFGRKRGPYGLVGWLWFLGTLVPVIGLVQVGRAALADRYTYFPSIGVFIIVAFVVRDWAGRLQLSPGVIVAAAVLMLTGCVALTENQLRFWRDDASLFAHAISVTRDNEPAHLCLGLAYEKEGRKADALSEFRMGLELNPCRVKTYGDIARLLAGSGRTNEALAELREALRRYPADVPLRDFLANLLADSGHTNEALAEFRETVRINPRDAALQNNLGALLVELGRFDEAMEHYAAAARLDPAGGRAPYLTGKALLKQGRDAEAVGKFREALRLEPDNLQILVLLARVLAADENPEVRDGQAAREYAVRANDLSDGDQPFALDALGMACAEAGRFDEAREMAQKAMDLATAAGTKNLRPLQQRLELYKNHQPWRESFLTTNISSPKTLPKN